MKHAGLASKRGRLPAVIERLVAVNGWREEDAALYLEAVFELVRPPSQGSSITFQLSDSTEPWADQASI